MVDVEAIKDKTSDESFGSKVKKKTKGAAGTVKEKVKEAPGKAKEKVKEKAKEKWEEHKKKKARSEAEERAYEEAKKEARMKEMSRVGEAEGISEARERAKYGIGGSKIGRAIKGMATRVNLMAEDTGGAFGTEKRKTTSFVDTSRIQDKLVGSTMSSDKLDVAPNTDLGGSSNRKMNLLSRRKGKGPDLGVSSDPDELFGGSSNKTSDLLNLGNKKRKIDFY